MPQCTKIVLSLFYTHFETPGSNGVSREIQMKVGFTGTRKGLSEHQMELLHQFFKENEIVEFHHGDSIGADSQAHQIYLAVHPGKKVFLHPTTKDRGFNKAENLVEYSEEPNPLKRNERIVRICDLLLVCPKSIQQEARSGTWATYRYAMKLKKKVLVLI